MNDKILVKKFTQLYQAKVCESLLQHQGIPCWIMNRMDSTKLLMDGMIELYVNAEDRDRTLEVLRQYQEEEEEEEE